MHTELQELTVHHNRYYCQSHQSYADCLWLPISLECDSDLHMD